MGRLRFLQDGFEKCERSIGMMQFGFDAPAQIPALLLFQGRLGLRPRQNAGRAFGVVLFKQQLSRAKSRS